MLMVLNELEASGLVAWQAAAALRATLKPGGIVPAGEGGGGVVGSGGVVVRTRRGEASRGGRKAAELDAGKLGSGPLACPVLGNPPGDSLRGVPHVACSAAAALSAAGARGGAATGTAGVASSSASRE